MEYSDKIRRKIVSADKTLIQTMKIMDESRSKSLLVFLDGKFQGMITIGDLQRAIISKSSYDTPIRQIIDNKTKLYAKTSDSLQTIRKWMIKMRAEIMPVLDNDNILVDVYFWDDLFNHTEQQKRDKINLPVVIMAGGRGSRLKPLTNVIPKPLIPIGDKTIIELIMDKFEDIGCHKFYVSINYKAEMIQYYLSQINSQYDIEFFMEDKPLGTIGSLSLLKGKISTPFFVSNCDSISEQDYRDVYDYHTSNRNEMTIVTMVKSVKIPYGVIDTGEDGLMEGLKEKPELTFMVNTGVYILNPGLIDEIPEGKFYHITHLIEKVKERKGRIGCFPVSEKSWKDVGEWKEYLDVINVL